MADSDHYPGLQIEAPIQFWLDVGYAVGVAHGTSPHDERITRILEELYRQSYNAAARTAGLPELNAG